MRDTILHFVKDLGFWVIVAVGVAQIVIAGVWIWMKVLSALSNSLKVTHFVMAAVTNRGELLRREAELEAKLQKAHDALESHMEECYECKNEQTWCDVGGPLYQSYGVTRMELAQLVASLRGNQT